MQRMMLVALLMACLGFASAVELTESVSAQKNPIRKVVTMLQQMEAKVTAEGEKEEELFEKFMCYCKNNVGVLEKSIQDAKDLIANFEANNEADIEKLKTTEASLKEHKASLAEAKQAMDKATALREKEAAAFATYKEEADTNIAAIAKAVGALEKGMGGAAFLQTTAASTIRNYAMEKADLPDETRHEILVFLSGKQADGYAPASGEIVGILKQMGDTMAASLKEATEAEAAAIKAYDGLMKAKTAEVDTLQPQIEKELELIGELKVKIAENANGLEKTKESLEADQKFLVELKKGCGTKEAEWKERCKLRQQELLALADTIKILNDDDALELFKKTLPGASASLVQIQVSAASMKAQALSMLREAKRHSRGPRPGIDLIALALNGKQQGFEKVIKMIDAMVNTLGKEQEDDDAKKEYCEKNFDELEDNQKVLKGEIKDAGLSIEEMTGTLGELVDEIKELKAGIAKLDKAVEEATAQRKEEAADFDELISSDTAAKELLLFAKNRLNKFYNPKLYKPPPKKELSSEDRIVENFSGAASLVQVSLHKRDESDDQVAPPPPPETFGAYSKKGEESNGVIAMVDMLVADLEKEMQTAKVDEKNAQEEYETLMSDSAAKRKQDAETLTQRETAKAETEQALEVEKQKKKDLGMELMGVTKELYAMHGECDWLLKFYDVRKQARTGEIDALGKAKAVLSGADYSLLQNGASAKRQRFLA